MMMLLGATAVAFAGRAASGVSAPATHGAPFCGAPLKDVDINPHVRGAGLSNLETIAACLHAPLQQHTGKGGLPKAFRPCPRRSSPQK